MNLFTKQKQTHRHRKQIYGYQRGGRGVNQEFEINRYTLAHTKQRNEDPLYSTGNYIQYLAVTYMEKNLKNNLYNMHKYN